MNAPRLLRTAALASALLPSLPALPQGLTWESTSTGGPLGDKPRLAKTYAIPRKFKREDESSTILVRLDKETIYLLKPKEKTYSEVTFAEIESLMKDTAPQLEDLQKKLKDLPPEQRQAVEKAFGRNPALEGKKDATIEVSATGERRDVSGHPATKVVAKEDGKEVLTAWVTRDFKDFEALRKDWAEVMRRMSAMNPLMGRGIGEAYLKIDGFPMETEARGVKTTVTKVGRSVTPDSDFEVPEGYTKTKSPFQAGRFGPPRKVPPKKKDSPQDDELSKQKDSKRNE